MILIGDFSVSLASLPYRGGEARFSVLLPFEPVSFGPNKEEISVHIKRFLPALLLTFSLLSVSLLAAHNVYFSVPLYCQKTPIWCGAASAQMTHNGYPTPPGPQFFAQSALWNCIQGHKDDPAVGWATDPDGLDWCLDNFMGHGPSGHWVVYANSSYSTEMYGITYWMTRQRYPTPVLVWNQQHWVVITGFTTDVDPVTHASVILQFVEFNNPWPPCSDGLSSEGTYHYVTAAQWQTNYFWGPVKIAASKWHGKYVAVLEPPKRAGRVAPTEMAVQGEPISPDEARELALKWVEELRLYERGPLKALRETRPMEPLLVNAQYKGYYLVPFGYRNKALAGIILNAYTGEFLDAGAFSQPIRYLSPEEALELFVKRTGMRPSMKPELIFVPSEQTEDYFWPLWKFTVQGEVVFYLDQAGRLYKRLTIPPPGD